MHIVEHSTWITRRTYRRPFVIAGGTAHEAISILVRLRGEDGLTGTGEATPMTPYSGETVLGVKQALDEYLLPAIRGTPASSIGLIHARMAEAIKGQPIAKAAVDLAVHDLLGKTWGVPVSELLGGRLRPSVPLAWAAGLGDEAEVLAEIEEQLQAGFRAVKVKIGRDPERDLRVVSRVRQVVGPAIDIRVDANEGYDLATARRVLPELERSRLSLIEQPISRWDLDGAAELCRNLATPIMADESLYSPHDAVMLVKHRAADVFNIKLMKVGGLYPAGEVAAIAAAAGVPCMVGSMPEMGVATAAGLHFAASHRAVTYPCELIGPLMLQGDIVSTALYPDGDHGVGLVPDGDGLGVELSDGEGGVPVDGRP